MGATLNLSVLEKLRTYQREGQPDIVTRLIDLFLGQAPNHVAEIQAALTACDAEALARAAHALKGTSANLGATRLNELAGLVERQARNAELNGAEQYVAALVAEFEMVQVDLAAQRTVPRDQTTA